MFRVGQKVVCVYDGEWQLHGFETTPKYRGVYTIRAISTDCNSGYGLSFEEIHNRPARYVNDIVGPIIKEKMWRSSRFRPLVEKKTDISVFTKMLTGTKTPANAS